jgi:hypothetical protein
VKTTKFTIIALALSLLAAPVFASNSESNNDSMAFHALGALPISEQAPTALDDQELAAVEGGSHLTTLGEVIYAVQILASANPALYGQIGQLANVISTFALVNALVATPHACSGFNC